MNKQIINRKSDVKIEVLIVVTLLISLGFPGNFSIHFGSSLGKVMEYTAFFLEIIAMLLSSGDHWTDIQIVDLEKQYAGIYLFVGIVFVTSMSVTYDSKLQLITCIRLVVTMLYAIWLQKRFSFVSLLRLLCIAQSLFVVFSLIYVARYPGSAFESGTTYIHALRGLYPTKNGFATELCFGIFVMQCLIHEYRTMHKTTRFWNILFLIQCVMLVLCQATGELATLLLLEVLYFFPFNHRLSVGWMYVSGNIIFLFATLMLMPLFSWIFVAIGKDATLTGRIPLWNQIIKVMSSHHTLTGYGFGMFWRNPHAVSLIHAGFDADSFMGTMTTGAHNFLLELWLNCGLLGISSFFMMILLGGRHITRLKHSQYIFCTMILFYLMCNGFVERCIGNAYDYKILSYLLIVAIMCNPMHWKEEQA